MQLESTMLKNTSSIEIIYSVYIYSGKMNEFLVRMLFISHQMCVVLSTSCNESDHTIVLPSQNHKSITQQLMTELKNSTCILITADINVTANVNVSISHLLITSINIIKQPWIHCNAVSNAPTVGITIYNSNNIRISDVRLRNCGYRHMLKSNENTNLVLSCMYVCMHVCMYVCRFTSFITTII